MKIKTAYLTKLLAKKFTSTYFTKEQANKIVDVLMYAEMVGKNTQGVLKLLGTEPMHKVKPKYEPKIVKETKVSALLDGGANPSILVCRLANEIAINKCREIGISIVGTKNTFSSSGVIGYYVSETAKNGFIGFAFACSPGAVAPFGSIDPLFGTNPLAVSFPAENDPIIFDMATGGITWYGLIRAKALGQKLPMGLAIDKNGKPTVDPDEAMKGAILPFDKSFKSSGLSLMVEVLTSSLTGATFANDKKGDWGNVFMAIDPEILVGKVAFIKNTTDLITKIRNSRKSSGFNRITIPGEKGIELKKTIEKSSEIDIEDEVFKQLMEV